jgi:amino acid permease
MAQMFMNKLNANEKQVIYGAIIVVIAYLVTAVSGFGFLGSGSGDLAAAVAIAVIYWLKYQPNQINWPIPPQTIVLGIAAVAAFFAVLAVVGWLTFIGISLYSLGIILNAVGCVVMVYGAWNEYQAMPKATPPPPPPAA